MCDSKTRNGAQCLQRRVFWVQVQTIPQLIGLEGDKTLESSPAGRSRVVCRAHLASAVSDLSTLEFRYPGRNVTVKRFMNGVWL